MGAAPVTPRPRPGGRTKSGKPRPGTGGYGKRKLEGKGPTPPARMRPGHPAQRKAAKAAAAKPSSTGPNAKPSGGPGKGGANRNGPKSRAAGSAEVVVGRNAVLESLRAGVPATALHVGPRLDPDERIGEAVMLGAGGGVPVVE